MADALGRSSLAIGLLVTGAGLQLEGLFRPSLAAGVAVFLKLVLMPVIAIALALRFGLTGANLAVVTICATVPTASSAYVLARLMGGDAPLLAQIITLQTILAAVTMPIAIALGNLTDHQRDRSHELAVSLISYFWPEKLASPIDSASS